MKTQNKKIVWLTNLRALACIAVITLHVVTNRLDHVEMLSTNYFILSAFLILTRWAVPAFFMMSGILLLGRSQCGEWRWVIRHVLHILIPSVIWGLLYVAQKPVMDFIKGNSLGQYNLQYFWDNFAQGEAYHLWFCFSLAGLYLMIPIMNKIVESKKIAEYFLAWWVICNFFMNYISNSSRGGIYTIWSNADFNIVTGYAGYMIFGYWLVNYSDIEKKLNKRKLMSILIITIVLAVGYTWGYAWIKGEHINVASPLKIVALILALTVVELVRRSYFPMGVCNILERVSEHSMGIYLLHSIVVIKLSYKGITSVMCTPIIAIPMVTALTFVLCFCVIWLIKKLPYIGKWVV